MVYLDANKIMECIDINSVTKDHVTFNVDGEKLVNEIFEDLKIELNDKGPSVILNFQDAPFIEIYPNEFYNVDKCRQLGIEVMHRLNDEIKSKLNIK